MATLAEWLEQPSTLFRNTEGADLPLGSQRFLLLLDFPVLIH